MNEPIRLCDSPQPAFEGIELNFKRMLVLPKLFSSSFMVIGLEHRAHASDVFLCFTQKS